MELVSRADMAGRLSLSRSAVWRFTQDPSFPTPFRLGRSVRWELSEVQAWLDSRRAGGADNARPVSYLRAKDCVDACGADDLDIILIPAS